MAESKHCPCASSCTLQQTMSMLGGKWKMPILCTLMAEGPSRYNAILRNTHGISNTVLSQMLKELERDNLIARKEYLEVPVRVEYALTEKGKSLAPIFAELIKWTRTYD